METAQARVAPGTGQRPEGGPGPEPRPGAVRVALASVAAGAINVAVAATVGRGSTQDLAFFSVVAAARTSKY